MSRRARGEGSVFKRSDGRWAGELVLGWRDGRRVRKFVYGRSQTEALRKLKAAQRAQDDGLPQPSERATVGGFLRAWIEDSATVRLRPSTLQSYNSIAAGHLIPAFEKTRLAKLTPADVEHYVASKSRAGLSGYSVRNHVALLRKALNDAVRWGLVPRNVAAGVKPPRLREAKSRPWVQAEAQQFLAYIQSDRLEALFALALGLGLRQSELLGLTHAAVDLNRRRLQVRAQLRRHHGGFWLEEPKTPRSRRTMSLELPLVDAIRRQRVVQKEEQLLAGPLWRGNELDLVFTTELGGPISAATLSRRFHALCAEAGLRQVRFHDCRHTYGSLLAEKGVPMRTAMDLMGHTQISTTAQVYQHVSEESMQDAAARVAGALWR